MNINLGIFCVVCKKNQINGPNHSFYKFPKDPKARILWLCILGFDKDTVLHKNAMICSDHFLAQYFETKPNGIKDLSSLALPVVHFKSKLNKVVQSEENASDAENLETISPNNYEMKTTVTESLPLSSSPLQNQENRCVEQPPRKDTSKNQRYARSRFRGTIPTDFPSATAKRYWETTNNTILQQRKKIQVLQEILRKLQTKVDSLNSSVEQLETSL